ncbi:MAG: hypothetical protein PHF70_05450 [Opitutales bacterium]|nr:hypothetical protein [Opitutales bacterium]
MGTGLDVDLSAWVPWAALLILGFAFFASKRWYLIDPSPGKGIGLRWIRWFLAGWAFATGAFALSSDGMGILRLFAVGFLAWGFFETVRNWFFVNAWSRNEWPLFPRYVVQEEAEWPITPRFFEIRQWLRDFSFSEVGFYKAFYDGMPIEGVGVFEDEKKCCRVNVYLRPNENGHFVDQIAFVSQTASGERVVTDNLSIAFGGVYPMQWWLTRKPLVRSIAKLHNIHTKTIQERGWSLIPFDSDPLEDMEESQRIMERLNEKAGYLNPRAYRSEFGKFTGEARYEIWKRIWLMNYLGLSPRSKQTEIEDSPA